MSENKKWELIASHNDKTLIRNKYASYLGNNLYNSVWNPKCEILDLVLNGRYEGTYIISEQIRIDESRVNIQNVADTIKGKKNDVNYDGVKDINDGGFIIEVDEREDANFCFDTEVKNITMCLKDPDTDDFVDGSKVLLPEVSAYIKNIMNTAERVLFSPDFTDLENGYSKYIDVDSFIDWFLVNEFTKNFDARWNTSVYLYYNPETKKIYMGPNWDFDTACGNSVFGKCDKTFGYRIMDSGWHERLFEDVNFVSKAPYELPNAKDVYEWNNSYVPNRSNRNLASASAMNDFVESISFPEVLTVKYSN